MDCSVPCRRWLSGILDLLGKLQGHCGGCLVLTSWTLCRTCLIGRRDPGQTSRLMQQTGCSILGRSEDCASGCFQEHLHAGEYNAILLCIQLWFSRAYPYHWLPDLDLARRPPMHRETRWIVVPSQAGSEALGPSRVLSMTQVCSPVRSLAVCRR